MNEDFRTLNEDFENIKNLWQRFLSHQGFTKIPNLLNLILLVDRSFYILGRSIGQTKVSVDLGKELTWRQTKYVVYIFAQHSPWTKISNFILHHHLHYITLQVYTKLNYTTVQYCHLQSKFKRFYWNYITLPNCLKL